MGWCLISFYTCSHLEYSVRIGSVFLLPALIIGNDGMDLLIRRPEDYNSADCCIMVTVLDLVAVYRPGGRIETNCASS